MNVSEVKEGMYILDDGRVRCFLFLGEGDAILIDTGFPDSNVLEEVRNITALPVKIVLTHGDMDHTGGLSQAGECYVHEGDFKMISDSVVKHEVLEGDVLKVGKYEFQVIHTPGHTYGSISFLEEKQHFMLTGDGVQKNGMIFMFGENRNFPLYIESLKKLSRIVKEKGICEIYPSHSEYPLAQNAVDNVLEDAENLFSGKIPPAKKHEFMPCNVYIGNCTGFLYQP